MLINKKDSSGMKHSRILLLGVMLTFAQLASAQLPPPGGGGGGGSNTTGAPIDGASGILLLAAAAYGYKQLRSKGNKQEEA